MATDSRKRTLEALERRIAFAKAEVLQKEKKNKKNINEDGKLPIAANSTTKDPSLHLLHLSSVTPKKGNFSFSGHTNSHTRSHFSAEGGSTDGILHELLQKGDASQKYMQGSRNMKIDNWIFLDNYVQKWVLSSGSQTRALQLHSKRSKKHMSMNQDKNSAIVVQNFKPMYEMWKHYIKLLLKSTGKTQLVQCLLAADLHGAFILGLSTLYFTFKRVSNT
ncbi:unnamed protein product [Sphenostylis stenocarpa]|uniref:Uncharacterized protein n=1 Tax=Sphenostylis stenocarpa TaxID=92480 RepID=A0AA86V3M6_9FABA|nr:unnamed protein product [Sphenostylis stenocarpa]